MRYQNTQGLFKPNKQLSRNARIKIYANIMTYAMR